MKKKDKKMKPLRKDYQTVDPFMNLPEVTPIPRNTAENKPMQRCVKFKNPMVALEHEKAMKMVEGLNPNLVVAKEVSDGYDMYVMPMNINDPYLNNIYTGINAIEMPSEDSIRINEVQMLNKADHDISLAYCHEKRRTMLISLTDMANSNFRSIIYHANKAVMDVLINSLNELAYAIGDDDKRELYDVNDYAYLVTFNDLDSIDLDMYQLLKNSNDLWEVENPDDPSNDIMKANIESSMNLSYGILYQQAMQAISTAYTSIGNNVRKAVYVCMKNFINIAQADLIYNCTMEYANDCMLNYGEVIFDNVQKICEALPSIQEAYYRRNINNWDQEKYGCSFEDLFSSKDDKDGETPKIGIF